jgi:DNA-binding MarR family transcriptional regulator
MKCWQRPQCGPQGRIAKIAQIDAGAVVGKATTGAYIAPMGKLQHYRVDDFRGETCVGYLISSATASNRQQLERQFEGEAITFTQWRVLMCLRDELANTCADISRELAHDKGSMTRLIDQLEERGFLRRQRDRQDRRIVFLTLTAAGRAAVNRLVPKLVDYYNQLLTGFTQQEVKVLTQLLKRLKDSLNEGDAVTTAREGARVS